MQAIEHFKQFLIGQDARNISALWQQMYRSQYFEGGRVLTAAMSAVDIALHDVVAKHLKCPVYQLLGGTHRHHVPVYVTCQAAMGQGAVDEAKKLAAEGWPCIRFGGQNIYRSENQGDATVGYMQRTYNDDPLLFEPRESIAQTVEWMPKVRAAVGNAVAIGIEYHHRLSVAEAANFIQKMPNGTLDWLEEPIRDESPEAYEVLRSLTPQPFALGEVSADEYPVVAVAIAVLAATCCDLVCVGVCVQVAVLAVHRERPGQFCSRGHLQHRRLHRGYESCGVGRGALCGPDATQSFGPDLHCRLRSPWGRCSQLCVDGGTHAALF